VTENGKYLARRTEPVSFRYILCRHAQTIHVKAKVTSVTEEKGGVITLSLAHPTFLEHRTTQTSR